MSFSLGDILLFDNEPCVVVGLSGQVLGEEKVPEDHIAVWFGGDNSERRKSEYKQVQEEIEVWTIPSDYFRHGPTPIVSH